MRVQVMWADIRQGSRTRPDLCAVALAVKRATEISFVLVSQGSILVGDHNVRPPRTVDRWVSAFDMWPHCWPFVRPFAFDLQLGGAEA